MTCAKRQVRCTLTLVDGTVYLGTNACANPQKECPRGPSDGYEKCKTICGQCGHAEEVAVQLMKRRGGTGEGGSVFLEGHDRVCSNCMQTLVAAGFDKGNVFFGRAWI